MSEKPQKNVEHYAPAFEKNEQKGKICSFEEGVQEVAGHILKLLQEKDVVKFSVYGRPHAGKSHFAREVMKEVWKVNEEIRGGEVKGYDEIPGLYGKREAKWVMLIQHPYLPASRKINDAIIQLDTKQHHMPDPDGALLLCGSGVDDAQIAELQACVDVVIRNPNARRK